MYRHVYGSLLYVSKKTGFQNYEFYYYHPLNFLSFELESSIHHFYLNRYQRMLREDT